MSDSEDKNNKPEKEERTEVIPIYDGKPQKPRSEEQAVIDLANDRPNTWSIIRND